MINHKVNGHWVKHEHLVKKWDKYVKDVYWTCSACEYRPYEGTEGQVNKNEDRLYTGNRFRS